MSLPIELDPDDFPGTPLFVVGPDELRVLDAIRAADLRGELAAAIAELRRGLAAVARLEERDEPVDESALQDAVDAWRSDLGLESAEETDAWLRAREIEIDDVASHLERRLAAERAGSEPSPDVDPDEISAALHGALVCSGQLERMCVELARRAAAHAVWVSTEPRSPSPADVESHAARLRPSVLAADPGLERLALLESVFELAVEASLGQDRIARAVEGARLDLLRLDHVSVSFPTLDAAREAVFCVEDDGEKLDRVARRAGAPVSQRLAFADELPEALRTALLSTRANRLAGPFEDAGRFVLLELRRKIEPTPEDPEVRARVSRRLRDRAFRDEMDARVRWTAWSPSSA